jgi:hypothetical protein
LFCAASLTQAKHTRPDDCLNKALAGIRWCCWSAARVCSATPDGPPGICLVPSTRRQPPSNSGSVRAFPFQILLRSSATKARRGHNGSVAYSRRSARSRLCSRLFLSRTHIQAKTGARAASLPVADTAGRAPMKFTSFTRAHRPTVRRETPSRQTTRYSANRICTSCLRHQPWRKVSKVA